MEIKLHQVSIKQVASMAHLVIHNYGLKNQQVLQAILQFLQIINFCSGRSVSSVKYSLKRYALTWYDSRYILVMAVPNSNTYVCRVLDTDITDSTIFDIRDHIKCIIYVRDCRQAPCLFLFRHFFAAVRNL